MQFNISGNHDKHGILNIHLKLGFIWMFHANFTRNWNYMFMTS